VGLSFFGNSDTSDGLDGAVVIGLLWLVLLNAAFFGMVLGQRQEHDSTSGRPSVDFAMTFYALLFFSWCTT
jgi:hypothetical protein